MKESFGRYRVVRQLGEGGMGFVYLAEASGPSGFSRRVVLKVVRDELNQALVRALLDEARLAATLIHRNIVPVLDLEQQDGRWLVVLEYVDGTDLHDLITRNGPIPWTLAVFIASEVAAALDYAHRKVDATGTPLSIVHRDVSAQNILVSREGEVKLTDFGVAQLASIQEERGIIGNRRYMAPEQARGETVDARADIYALGVVLFELLTGGAFEVRPTERLLKAQTFEEPALEVPRERAPEALVDIVRRATDPDRSRRFHDAAQLRDALVNIPGQPPDPARELAARIGSASSSSDVASRRLLEEVLGGGLPMTGVAPAPEESAETKIPNDVPAGRAQRRSLVRVAVVASLIALATGGALVLTRSTRDGRRADSLDLGQVSEASRPVPTPLSSSMPASVSSPRGTLSINSIPWARLYVDGRAYGHTPRMNLSLPAGPHVVRLVTPTGEARTKHIQISAGREQKLSVSFSDP